MTNQSPLFFIRDKNNLHIKENAASCYSDVSHSNSSAIQETLFPIHGFH